MEQGNTQERVLHGQEGYEPKQGWVRGFSIPGLKEGDAPARRKHQGSVSHIVSSVVMDSKSAVPQDCLRQDLSQGATKALSRWCWGLADALRAQR